MAMGNYCYKSGTECGYANNLGRCRFEEYGLCEMDGDTMPDKMYPFGTIIYKVCKSYAGKKNFINPITVKEVIAQGGWAYIRGSDAFGQSWSAKIGCMKSNGFYLSKEEAQTASRDLQDE